MYLIIPVDAFNFSELGGIVARFQKAPTSLPVLGQEKENKE
jgi:hypothetical protein